jgi:ribosomal protein S18 acetylase RimI-like enzyme
VHADHRGHGYGRAICVAAAGALQRLGASSALVCTARVAGIAAYRSAGFHSLPERLDIARPA